VQDRLSLLILQLALRDPRRLSLRLVHRHYLPHPRRVCPRPLQPLPPTCFRFQPRFHHQLLRLPFPLHRLSHFHLILQLPIQTLTPITAQTQNFDAILNPGLTERTHFD